MALVLPRSIFFHVGRTAGHCVRKTIRAMGIPTHEVGHFHDWPSNTRLEEADRQKLFFCFVRHPLTWLRSFWSHQMQFGWDGHVYSRKLQDDSFAGFLAKALEAFPDGAASEAFRPFVTQCEQIGRQESLAEDLGRILGLAGEAFDVRTLRSIDVVTVEIDKSIRECATAPEELLRAVMASERGTCEEFHYSEIPKGMIGPAQACLAAYVPLGNSKHPVPNTVKGAPAIGHAFTLNGEVFAGPPSRQRVTVAIRKALDGIDFAGKDVIDTSSGEGVFCFYAESKGAANVVGVNRKPAQVTSTLKSVLDSKVTFVTHRLYGQEQVVDGQFDVALCLDRLHLARHPYLLIRSLGRLLKRDGTLVLGGMHLRAFDGIPVMYAPLASESPVSSEVCSCFNREGLFNALTTYGFQDFKVVADLDMGVDDARDFARMPFDKAKIYHDSESAAGWLLLTCRYAPASADQDPRFRLDGHSRGNLVEYWDGELPEGEGAATDGHGAALASLASQVQLQAQGSLELRREVAESRALLEEIRERLKHPTGGDR